LAPDVDEPSKLFDFCAKAKCSTGPIPASRWRTENYHHPDPNKRGHYNVSGLSMLERDVAAFDAPFFNLGEAETKAMDPQERLMLECAYLALENAGITISQIAGRSDVGVFNAGSRATTTSESPKM
jgi:acyl transferase domain-containing protein